MLSEDQRQQEIKKLTMVLLDPANKYLCSMMKLREMLQATMPHLNILTATTKTILEY